MNKVISYSVKELLLQDSQKVILEALDIRIKSNQFPIVQPYHVMSGLSIMKKEKVVRR